MSSIANLEARLSNGSTAPEFSTTDIFGQPIQLSSYRGKPVLLSFFRNGACALCNLRVHQLIQRYPEYHAAGLEVLAIFESPLESIRQYVGKQDAPFAIISDPGAVLYSLYGIEVSEEKLNATMSNPLAQARVEEAAAAGYKLIREEGSNFLRMPADFLIDAEGRIHTAFYSEWVGEHLAFELIEDVLGIRHPAL